MLDRRRARLQSERVHFAQELVETTRLSALPPCSRVGEMSGYETSEPKARVLGLLELRAHVTSRRLGRRGGSEREQRDDDDDAHDLTSLIGLPSPHRAFEKTEVSP